MPEYVKITALFIAAIIHPGQFVLFFSSYIKYRVFLIYLGYFHHLFGTDPKTAGIHRE